MSDWYPGSLARQDEYGDLVAPDERGFQPQKQTASPSEMRSYDPSWTERLKGATADAFRRLGADNYIANKLGDIATTGLSMFPPVGLPLAVNEMQRGVEHGDATDVVLGAVGAIPGAKKGSEALRAAAKEIKAASVSPGIGHNMPPPEFRMAPEDVMGGLAEVAPPPSLPRTWAQELPRSEPSRRSTEIPPIRDLPAAEGIETARKQHHLIRAGDQSEGYFVGGPREIQSKRALNTLRKQFDEYLGADPRGMDWYDRYRRAMDEVTGGNPVQNRWMANQEGQWSAGVDPGSEVHFALKENNASIAGMPVKAARPAQHEAHLAAIAARDPSLYQLGDKTGEYADLVNATRTTPAGATGVNDFRHARNWRYTEMGGEAQKGALTEAQHKFLDYETALAVDRANKMRLGGRDDWTGEKLQAAPWVRQKAFDIMERNPALTYEEAFTRANRQVGDYFDRHTYSATHEVQPGVATGHMMGSVAALPGEKAAYAADPRSTWATAPGGRDAIYSGLGIPGTGVNMRVRPTIEMQGMYQGPQGLETNPGWVARPLGTFNVGGKDEPFKSATPADRAIMNAGEAWRAAMDAQQAGAWHKLWFGGPAKESNSLVFARPGKASVPELQSIQRAATPYGMPDITDTGGGILATRYWPAPEGSKDLDRALRKGEFGQFGTPKRARVDSDLIDYSEQWKEGIGSGAVTRKMLGYINETPEIRAAFNNNPYLADRALMQMERDVDWTAKWQAPREDVTNLRAIVAESKGKNDVIDRIEAALEKGVILPATAAGFFAAMGAAQEGEGRGGS